jgi:hypothetical protein
LKTSTEYSEAVNQRGTGDTFFRANSFTLLVSSNLALVSPVSDFQLLITPFGIFKLLALVLYVLGTKVGRYHNGNQKP